MEREVRYCTTEDGGRVAYCVQGQGPPLLCTSAFVESFALDHYVPAAAEFFAELARTHTLIRLDWEGTGLSSRSVMPGHLRTCVQDLAAVADHAGLDRFAIWAPGTGPMPVFTYAIENLQRVSRIVVYGGFATREDAYPRELVAGLAQMARTNWPVVAQTIGDMTGRRDFPEEAARLGDWYRDSVEQAASVHALEGGLDWDATDCLPRVTMPVLVIHNVKSLLPPFSAGQRMVERLPNARLLPLTGVPGSFFVGQPEEVIRAVNQFLGEDGPSGWADGSRAKSGKAGALRTVLFTDLVGHTEMMQRLGDDRGRDVLREHERITREVLKANGGTEVKTMGDGFMASFGSVTKAVECAIALQRAFAGREGEPLNVRVGLNAGEPIEEDGDLFGATVILASRIAAKAGGGEILVADTVRGLCSGKGFLFADRGDFVAKGIEEPVRISEVNWHS